MIGQGTLSEPVDSVLLQQQYQAGVRGRVIELGWDVLQPNSTNDWVTGTAAQFQQRIDAFCALGTDVFLILDLGLQYPPAWMRTVDPIVDQYGRSWASLNLGGGIVNVFWSSQVRAYVANYVQKIFTGLNFRNRLQIVRLGFYYGELTFPILAAPTAGQPESMWAYDATAQAAKPSNIAAYRPADPSQAANAEAFYDWYVDSLVGGASWALHLLRQYTTAKVAVLTPGSGASPDAVRTFVQNNCYVAAWSGFGTGFYWDRVYANLPSAADGCVNWCSSVGDGVGNDDSSPDRTKWSSAHVHGWLAAAHSREIYAENPGNNYYDTSTGAPPFSSMVWDAQLCFRSPGFQYSGLMWVRQSQMSAPHATLANYASLISAYESQISFSDVPSSRPEHDAIIALAARGVISGYADGTFRPEAQVTRGQASKMVFNAMGWRVDVDPVLFADMPTGSLYADFANTLKKKGVISGYGCGSGVCFYPGNNITKGQLIKVVTMSMTALGNNSLPFLFSADQSVSGLWQLVTTDPGWYPGMSTAFRIYAITYSTYLQQPIFGVASLTSPWPDWSQSASRAWFAETLYLAIAGGHSMMRAESGTTSTTASSPSSPVTLRMLQTN